MFPLAYKARPNHQFERAEKRILTVEMRNMDAREFVFFAIWGCFAVISCGCSSPFSMQKAQEVSRDKLISLAEKGHSDHLVYVGSDFQYHYAYDSRPGKERTYKINAKNLRLKETFSFGDDAYVLHPWMIEGKLLGYPAEDVYDEMKKTAHHSEAYVSGMDGTPQPVVEGPPQSDFREEVGEDQIESGSIESP